MSKASKKAAEAASYEELLEKSWDELPQEVVGPNGSYVLDVESAMRKPASQKEDGTKVSEQVIFFLKVREARDDVDTDALDEALKAAKGDIGSIKVDPLTIWIESATDYQKVGRFLAVAGLKGKVPNLKELSKVRGAGGTIVAQLEQRSFTPKGEQEAVHTMRVKQYAKDEG